MSKAPDPTTPSAEHNIMAPRWAKIATVLGGTEAMREAGMALMPMHRHESMENYRERLDTAVLFNMVELTLETWVGQPFSEPVEFSPDMPEAVRELMEDVDLRGTKAGTFLREWFSDGVAMGIAGVFVDQPGVRYEDGNVRTLRDDMESNLRPYWSIVKPETILDIDETVVDGRPVTTQLRLLEAYEAPGDSPFERLYHPQVSHYYLEDGAVQLDVWRQENPKRKKTVWKKFDSRTLDIDEIPFTPFYAGKREAPLLCKPPMLDLADINIQHWQSSSDQNIVLSVARFPLLAVSGAIDEDHKLVIGPKKFLHSPDPSGKFYYVEHSGAAIAAGDTAIQRLEEKGMQYGAEFLKKRPGSTTATARALDSAEATSSLQDTTMRFMEAVESVLRFTAKWLGTEEPAGHITITTDFGPNAFEQSDSILLDSARERRDISREQYLKELGRRGTLGDEFDPKLNDSQLKKEAADAPKPILPIQGEPEDNNDDE